MWRPRNGAQGFGVLRAWPIMAQRVPPGAGAGDRAFGGEEQNGTLPVCVSDALDQHRRALLLLWYIHQRFVSSVPGHLRCYIKAFSFWAWPAVGDIGSKLSSSTSSSESHDAVGPGSSRPTSELPRKDGADLFPRTRRMRTHLRQSLPHAAAAHSLCDSAPQDEHCVIRSSSHRNSRSSEPQISQQCPFSWQRRHLPSTWPSETLVTLDTHTLLYLS